MSEWSFPSSSSDATYTARRDDGGRMSCNCRGFTFKRGDKPRECKHIKQVIADQGFARSVRGEFIFAGGEPVVTMQGPRSTEVSVATVDRALALADGDEPSLIAPAPMLASAMTDPVTGQAFDARYGTGEWFMDVKLDGHRCVVVKRGEQVQGWARPRAGSTSGDFRKALPANIIAAVRELPDGIYDGELMAPGGKSSDVTIIGANLTLVLFDVLEIMGTSTMNDTAQERRSYLALALDHVTSDAVKLVDSFETPTWSAVEAIWTMGGEGAVVKRRAGIYRANYRTDAWVKIKKLEAHTVTIIGFDAGSFGPHSIVQFKFADGVESRCKTKNNEWLRMFAENPESFIGRRLVIECVERTKTGSPRHPMAKSIDLDHLAGETE